MNTNAICIHFAVPFTTLGSFHLRTRVVIITDGKPTDFGTENSDDIYESMGLDNVRENALQ